MQLTNTIQKYFVLMKMNRPLISEQFYRRAMFSLLLLLALLIISSPELAMAATPWEDSLDKIKGILTGGMAQGIATIAIVVLGIMAAAGKLEWGTAIKVIVGLVLIFGATNIVNWAKTAFSGSV